MSDSVTRVPTPPDREVFVYNEYEHGPTDYGRRTAAIKRVSWGAIFAGALIAIVTGFVLNLLGLGMGLQAFDPASDPDTLGGFGVGQGIWAIVSALVSLFAGGWVAGRLAGMPRSMDGAIHGLTAWALTTLLTVYLLTSGVGRVVSGVGGLIGSGLSAVGSGVAAVAPEAADAVQQRVNTPSLDQIQAEAQQILRETDDPNLQPEALTPDAEADLRTAIEQTFGQANQAVQSADREDLVNVIVAETDMTEAEARQTVNEMETRFQTLRGQVSAEIDTLSTQAVSTAEDATDFLGTAALIGFLALLLGAVAAAFGGKVGAPDDLPADAFSRRD